MSANRTILRRLLFWVAGAFLAVTAGAFLAGCGSSGYYYDYDGYGYPTYYDYGYDYNDWPPPFEGNRRFIHGEGSPMIFQPGVRGERGASGDHWVGHSVDSSSAHTSGHSGGGGDGGGGHGGGRR